MRKFLVLFLVALISICLINPGLAAWRRGEAEAQTAPQVGERIMPRRAEIDTNGDGKVDRIENYDDNGVIQSVKSDTNFDGTYDEWLYYENGKLIKAAKDTNGDGKEDTWLTY